MDNIKYLTTKDLPETHRPYEKCEQYGPGALTDAELLSVIIKSGTAGERSIDLAMRILNHNDSGLLNLNYMSISDLRKFNGIGRVKAIQLKCICELTDRITRLTRNHGNSLDSPEKVAAFYMERMRYLEREQLMLIMLDIKSRLITDIILSKGTVNSTVVSARDIFRESLKAGAVSIIMIHNHPSGDPSPSGDDLQTTARIKEAGEILGVLLADHIIIGDNCFFSFKEAGYI